MQRTMGRDFRIILVTAVRDLQGFTLHHGDWAHLMRPREELGQIAHCLRGIELTSGAIGRIIPNENTAYEGTGVERIEYVVYDVPIALDRGTVESWLEEW